MFFSSFILQKRGPLAKMWLAAHWDRKLTKALITETDIRKSVGDIENPEVPIALRTSGHLLLGVVKIYSRKVKYVLQECNEAMTKIKLQIIPVAKIDLPEKLAAANFNAITLPTSTSSAPVRDLDLLLPDIDLGAGVARPEGEEAVDIEQFRVARIEDITMDEFDRWEVAEETPSMEAGLAFPTPSTVEALRRELQTPSTGLPFAGPPPDIEFEFGMPATEEKRPPSVTSDRISRISAEEMPAPEEMPFGGDFGVPFPEEEMAAPEYAAPEERVPVIVRRRKRRVIEDAETEIATGEIRSLLNDPSPLLRVTGSAPRTFEDMQRREIEPQTIDDLFRMPGQVGLGTELSEVFQNNLRAVKRRRIEAAPIARQQMEEMEEMPPMDFGAGFGAGFGAEFAPEEGEDELARRRRETIQMEEPAAIEEMVDTDMMAIGHEEETEVEREQRLHGQQDEMRELKAKFSGRQFTDRTVKVAMLLRENLRSTPEPTDKLNLLEMLEGRKKSTAARCFYEVLVLTSKALVTVDQQESFGDIMKTMSDMREKAIFSIIAEACKPLLSMGQVEQYFQHDQESQDTLNRFVNGDATVYSMLFAVSHASESEAFHVIGPSDSLQETDRVLYIIRKCTSALPHKEQLISENILFGVILNEPASQYQHLLKQIFIPVLKKQSNWGKFTTGETEEFISTAEKFADVLSETVASQIPKVMLPPPEPTHNIGMQKMTELKYNNSMVTYSEGLMEEWIKEINIVLSSGDGSYRDDGPMEEIMYWKDRFGKITSIMEQLKQDDFKPIIELVKISRSHVHKRWKELDNRLTDNFNEAKDNVKYLKSIEKYIAALYRRPVQIIDIIPGLMKNIRMMNSIARYYSTDESMSNLLVKISNQMISTCKDSINSGGRLWDQEPSSLLENLRNCKRLNQEYRRCYRVERNRATKQINAKQFDFDELTIFGKFDLFVSRVDQLIELFSIIDQLNTLKEHNIDGLEVLIKKFFGYVDDMKRRSTDLLDFTKNSFDKDYMAFNANVENIEQSLQVFLNTSFENISSTQQALVLLHKFQGILQRDSLRTELENKYTVIFHNYSHQLDSVQKTYERNKAKPRLVRNAPLVAGNVIWCRQLMRRIEEPMKKFQEIPIIMRAKENKKVIRNYNKIMKALYKFEHLWIDEWKKGVAQSKAGLEATLIVKVDGRYYVNFDREIIELIRESKWLHRMGVDIPDTAQMILSQESKFKHYHTQLNFTLSKYHRIIETIHPDILHLLAPQQADMEKRIEPGTRVLQWSSTNIDAFISSVLNHLSKFENLVFKINDIIAGRIQTNMKIIGDTPQVSLPQDESFSLDKFVSMQERHISSLANELNNKNIEIEKAVDDVIQACRNFPMDLVTSSKDMATEERDLKLHFEGMLLNAIVQAITKSFHALKQKISGDSQESPTPFFIIDIELSSSGVVLNPSLDDIQEAINRAASAVLSSAKNLKPWKCSDVENAQAEEDFMYTKITKDKEIVEVITLLNGGIHGLRTQVLQYIDSFKQYQSLWLDDKIAAYEDFLKAHQSSDPQHSLTHIHSSEREEKTNNLPRLEDFEMVLRKYRDLEEEISLITDSHTIGSLCLMTEFFKESLRLEASAWKTQYAKNLHQIAHDEQIKLVSFVEEQQKVLNTTEINSLENLRTVMDVLKEIRENEVLIDRKFSGLSDQYSVLRKYSIDVPKEEIEEIDELPHKWSRLALSGNCVNETVGKLQGGFKKRLMTEVELFQVDVLQFRREFEERGPMVQTITPQEAIERLNKYTRLYEERHRKFLTYHAGEGLFGLTQNRYPELEQTEKELRWLKELYSLYMKVIEKISGYADILWSELDFQAITDEITVLQNQCKKLPKQLKQWPVYINLSETIENFLKLHPLLERLKDPAMKTRHWNRLQEIVGQDFKKEDEIFKLKHILDAHLLDYSDDVEDVCISAVREAEIEKKLDELAEEWKSKELSFAEYGNRGPVILKGQDTTELMEALEEAQMMVGGLLSKRHIGFFRVRASAWMATLSGVMDSIESWLDVQFAWNYMASVFQSGDISSQLPVESKKFNSIDKAWIKIMDAARANPRVTDFCYENEMLKILPHLKLQLEECQKGLSGYLGQKRDAFARFFFCSDEVLLEILSQSSNPHSIQSHLSQVFDSINRVTFDKKQENKILSMHSGEGETVQLAVPTIAKGHVEDWLKALEREMMRSVKNIIREAAEDSTMASSNLRGFIDKYPSQVALLGIQFIWTIDSEEALQKAKSTGQIKPLNEALKRMERVLAELTNFTTQDLSPLNRTKIETLITIQVHQRDVFADLVRAKIKDPSDFEWQRQARFYWRPEIDDCVISIADIEHPYCYEYLGCKERLVITPLTDRCYVTLSQAIGLKLGGAPAGPAGTGKTETVKDLGRTLGKYVVVFNCSDQLDYRAMAKIFRGISQSGAWGNFDEFNRIELEVLSVVAQQIQSILTAMREVKKEFMFTDGKVCHLNPECALFITMNPGYQGRQELPENLKVLFRGVAMMVPDREIIIRVKLAAAGYTTKELAKKFNVLYRLCEQQLSKQPHYDFGLRNILSVLRTAGETKRSNTDKKEDFLLFRTLRDMNTSKLVQEDVSLFHSLIHDLFPGMEASKRLFPELEASIRKHTAEENLILYEPWFEKVIQLYETALVRHGIMVLGPSGSGKSSCFRILLKALSDVEEPNGTPKRPHKEFRMNPKAITAPEMFGLLDTIQNEWTDGIFSALWKAANKTKKNCIWIICDGPVDAIWIENLNTVLDDNKLLTLANGDRLPMSPTVKMCFEVEDLRNASPATVSRAGQIYMSETVLGWEPVIDAKLLGKPGSANSSSVKPFTEKQTAIIKPLFQKYATAALNFVNKYTQPMIHTGDVQYVVTCFDLLYALVKEHSEDYQVELSEAYIEKLFLFALVWGVGGLLEVADQSKFSDWLQGIAKGKMPSLSGTGRTVFDYHIDKQDGGIWRAWKDIVPRWVYPENDELNFSTLFVPTPDSVRTEYLIRCITNQEKSVLLIGGSGTAKTVTVEQVLGKLDQEKMMFKKINFSSATTPRIFQTSIQSVIEKRFRAFGPPGGKKMVIFIDDINMPEINEWGDQVGLEIVRQLLEMSGFYSLEKPGEFIHIEDLQYIAAMSHPGGGKNDIPSRLKRQFSIFNITLPSTQSIDMVFGNIIRGRYNVERGFSEEIVDVAKKITPATIAFWRDVGEKMLPTPSKFHYIFNLRDLSRIYHGLMLCPGDVIKSKELLLKLWKHECTRVFSDRLNDVQDKIWFDKNVQDTICEHFGDDLGASVEESTYFVNFLHDPVYDEETGEEISKAPKIYEPAESVATLRQRLEGFMKMYNEIPKTKKLDIVLFDIAIKHLVRISRIISMPRGNALLVGVGGSGKQSLTRLATFIADYEIRQIVLHKTYSVNNLFDDLREYYKLAGLVGKPVTFIFTDNEIKQETFLEYINNILSSGEIPGLFPKDDLDIIVNDLRPVAKKLYPDTIGKNDTWDNLYKFFIDRVRDNLHIVLCFSPVGEKFRLRAQKFPGIISGASIDWFFSWPEDALVSVARKVLGSFEMSCDEETKSKLIHHMANVHLSMNELSGLYFERYRRHVYTTPKSYLSFIELYMEVYTTKLAEYRVLADQVNNGLDKLNTAADDVEDMKVVLKVKEEKLAVQQVEVDKLMKDIAISKAATEAKKEEVQTVKDKLQIDRDYVQKQKDHAQSALEKAEPALKAAVAAVNNIKPNDINDIKKLIKPPDAVKVVLDAVLVLRQQPLNPVTMATDKDGNKIVGDSFQYALRMMSDVGFLKSLVEFDSDSMNLETIELLEPYIRLPNFNVERMRKSSLAAASLCEWVLAMHTYFHVSREVKPLQENLMIQQAKLDVAQSKLAAKEKELAIVQAELDTAQAKFEEAQTNKQILQDDAEATRRRMEQANNLIEALSGEKDRWTKQSTEFEDKISRLTGDAALSCAFISYCGPFNSEFRSILLNQSFYKDCVAKEIPVTKNVDVIALLTDEAQIGEWNIDGLPSDDHSVQNAIMVTRSTKWPLLVDPQGQGLNWLKRKEARALDLRAQVENKRSKSDNVQYQLKTVRMTDKYFRQHLEEAIANGLTLIIENIDEELDPMLDPVLEKDIEIQGKNKTITIADKQIDYDDNFKLFLCTKLSNPHFSPELYAKATVVEFAVTLAGLEQQLLAYVIQKERAELEESREKLLQEVNMNQKKIKLLEDTLLKQLSDTKGNLLDDENLIHVLAQTKKTASDVNEKLENAKETSIRIDNAREEYRPVAIRGSVLYFLIVEMSLVNPMYQTSLSQFLFLFDRAIDQAAKAPLPSKRIDNIIERASYSIYTYINQGLFKRHKFLFVLLMACKVQLRDNKISYDAFSSLLKGGGALDIKSVREKVFNWIPDTAWLNIINLSNTIEVFSTLPDLVARNEKLWKRYYDEERPELAKVPELHDRLSTFEILLLVRSFREDRTVLAAQEYIRESIGQKYIDPLPVNLEETLGESSNIIPLVCLLSPGSDPTSMIEGLAKKKKKEVPHISMGQGQEKAAAEKIRDGFANGNWVLLQNCHLGLRFVQGLEDQIKEASEKEAIHPDFRLWITSEPNPQFPIGLLQMSIKLTLEGDVGVKAGMKSAFQWVSQDVLDASRRPEWRPLVYSICYLSTVVAERRKFGPLGFSIPYEFNASDLTASISFLQNHFAAIGDDLKKGPQISWSTIKYMICEVHYGGKITDDFDRILFKAFGNEWLNDNAATVDYQLVKKNTAYAIPNGEEKQKYLDHIEKLPAVDIPEVFGLHSNADIAYRTQQSQEILSTILDVQPKESSGTGGETRESKVIKIADDLLSRLPNDFKREEFMRIGSMKESLNVFLKQEIDRLQRLITAVRTTLADLKLAIDGTIIMSSELRDALDNLHDARVPTKWLKLSWEASTLGLWFTELLGRQEQLHNWLTKERPRSFWLTGFYNPQGFLTAVQQEVARKKGWALDKIMLRTEITKEDKDSVTALAPGDGVYVHGVSLEGAGWNRNSNRLTESDPTVLFVNMPVIYITATDENRKDKRRFYSAPVYRTKRRTDLNYVFSIDLPCPSDVKTSHWILRGVCLLLSLS